MEGGIIHSELFNTCNYVPYYDRESIDLRTYYYYNPLQLYDLLMTLLSLLLYILQPRMLICLLSGEFIDISISLEGRYSEARDGAFRNPIQVSVQKTTYKYVL